MLSTCWPWDVDWSSLKYLVAVRNLGCGLRWNFASFGCHSNVVAYYFDFVAVLYNRETYVPIFRNQNKLDNPWIDDLFGYNVCMVVVLCYFCFVADLVSCENCCICCFVDCYCYCICCSDCFSIYCCCLNFCSFGFGFGLYLHIVYLVRDY